MRAAIAIFFGMLTFSLFAMEQRSTTSERFTFQGHHVFVETNRPLNDFNEDVDRIIVAIQGNKRDARARVRAIKKAARPTNVTKRILIISPKFKIEKDERDKGELYWTNNGWKQGDDSIGDAISSFAVLDAILHSIITSGKFPRLSSVFVSGHSAGAQFAQRYALTSQLMEKLPKVQFSFLVLNPSSYAYLNKFRPDPHHDGNFMKLSEKELRYNRYKYGLTTLNPYAKPLTNKRLRNQYLNRTVYYVLGQDDNDPCHEELDCSAEAMLQGRNRLERGRLYFAYLKAFYSPNLHHKIEVPDVGHDAKKMYATETVKAVLFYEKSTP